MPEFVTRHPAGSVAVAGLLLLLIGSGASRAQGGLGGIGVLGFLVLLAGLVAMAGTRRATWRYGALRAGIDSVDVMTGTQFELLLEALFTELGYRVTRVGGRSDFGADLLLDSAGGRTVVQAKRWLGVVRHDAVQQAVAAKAHYRAQHAMVVTSSHFSEHARKLANSNGVVLWDRRVLTRELANMRGLPVQGAGRRFFASLGAGCLVCAAVLGRVLEASATTSRRSSRRRPTRRRR